MTDLEDKRKKILEAGKDLKTGECTEVELETEEGTVTAEVCRTGEKRLEVKKVKQD